ncbi:hypothetical protein LWI29_002139 [Acer saccharum]|uniref:Protein kinase domain-containing protein n=1 Tax=Acer saccharum TaxID=4024 RepID=A0AA39STW1_ACESA|nr:hypothetical protein LWI29_002139 [Acer saccharum]
MEALGSLIELVGANLGHRHPRLRNWRIFRRPHDFFSKFAKYEQAVKDGQFVPDNLEEDDGRQRLDAEVGNDDNDGGQSRPQQKKRKRSPRKQKITAKTKRQRTSGDTSPVGDDSTVSSQTTRQLMREMSDRFKDIVKKEISAMERRIKRRLTRVEKSVAQLVDARRQTTPEVHNFSTPQHQYDHRGISSPLGGGDDLHGGRDSTHGGGVGDGTHGERDGTNGRGDSTHGGGVRDGTHGERDGTNGRGDSTHGGGVRDGTHGERDGTNGERDSTYGRGVGDDTHGERDGTHGGGDDIHGGGNMLLLMVASQLAQPGLDCARKCGNLEIPYPFGTNVANNCSLNKHFLITCKDYPDKPPEAYWGTNSSNFVVTNISMEEGQLYVRSLVSRDCNNSKRFGVSLCVGDFRISETKNKFTVIGCESYGYIHGVLNGKNYSQKCKPSCQSLDDVINGSCSGSGCCQIPIPNDLRDIRVYANSSNKPHHVLEFSPCSYAFVSEDSKFNFSSSYLSNMTDRFPTVVDWAITEQGNCSEAKNNAVCQKNALCKDANYTGRGRGYLCHCKDGYQGNPYVSPGCKCKKGCNTLPIALGVGLGSVMLIVGSYGIYYEFRKRRLIKLKQQNFEDNGGPLLQQPLPELGGTGDTATIFPTDELEQATNNFDEEKIIGRGRNGPVYKGILKDNNPVAIKKSKKVGRSQPEPFINQVKVLSKINHRNVVKLLGCCLETEVPLLVYEFVTNGSLFDHIHKKDNTPTISWETRLRIAAETAGVLSYLHSDSDTPVIHRDVKSSNILLDDNFTPKVSDFGPSNLVSMDVTQLSTMVQDTLGYLDPEYMHTGQLTEKSDVYSFGVVLVELMTGKQALSFDGPEEDRRLVVKFSSLLKKGRLSRILDNGITKNDNYTNRLIKEVAELASRCLNVKGEERPLMKEVAMELKRLSHLGDDDEGGTEEIKQSRSEKSYTDNYGDGNNSTTMYDSMEDQVRVGLDGETEDFE